MKMIECAFLVMIVEMVVTVEMVGVVEMVDVVVGVFLWKTSDLLDHV